VHEYLLTLVKTINWDALPIPPSVGFRSSLRPAALHFDAPPGCAGPLPAAGEPEEETAVVVDEMVLRAAVDADEPALPPFEQPAVNAAAMTPLVTSRS